MATTQHCWKCGQDWPWTRQPGRSEICAQCGADLKVCLNCAHYAKAVAYQCRERRAEPVEMKELANYCEWFELARREYVPPDLELSRENKARDALKKLLGD